jgi:hypothetical protein
MQKPHPLTRLQLILAILWAIPSCILTGNEESSSTIGVLFMAVPFLGMSIVTIIIGFVMVIRKENITYPFETFAVRVVETVRGKQAADHLISEYSKPGRQKGIGVLNILSGLLCFLVAITLIVGSLREF